MENREHEFLSEVKGLISDLRVRIEYLESKIAEYENRCDSDDPDSEPVDLDIEEVYPDREPIDDMPEDIYGKSGQEQFPEPDVILGPEPEPEPEPEPKQEPEPEPEPEPGPEPEPELEPEPEPEAEEEEGMMMEEQHQLWRTDMPGSPVKDIRSGISLNDRILFINTLFRENPLIFQDAVNAINGMESLQEVVRYVNDEFPEWNMDSETVYRFMMAARRRVR